uniref:Uncharacterized protein n=1 Tax=Rhizophora mucronata TaxID=61149 RepID=A0A2P2PUN4_RHIMU
MRKEEEKLSF